MGRQNSDNLTSAEIEKLLSLASKPKKQKAKKEKKENPDVINFINELGIKAGKKTVPTYIIYYRYSEWKKTKLLARTPFFKQFKKHFQQKQIVGGVGYALDPKPFDLTHLGFFKARALLRRERHERKKEKAKT